MKKLVALFILAVVTLLTAAPNVQFAVMSDTQPGRAGGRARKGTPYWSLEYAYKKFDKLGIDAILFAGDISVFSIPAVYDEFRSIYDDTFAARGDKAPKFLPVMGNHDYWVPAGKHADPYAKNRKTQIEREEIFKKHLKLDTVNHHVVVKGYDFIGISFHGGTIASKENLAFVQQALEKAVARDPKKPIFVYAHNHVANTVLDSGHRHNLPLYELFKKYPQVVYFSGHTHRPNEDERTIHQRDFTSIGTSTMNYTWFTGPLLYPHGSHTSRHAMHVSVEDDKITVRRFQIKDDTEILDNGQPWIIPLPFDPKNPKYDFESRAAREVAPEFPKNATMKAEPVLNKAGEFTGVRLTGTAATHPRYVSIYTANITVKNDDGTWSTPPCIYLRRSNKGDTIREIKTPFRFLGDFYLGLQRRKPQFNVVIPINPPRSHGGPWLAFDFMPGKTYRFEVTAEETYGKKTATSISAEVTMPAKKAPQPAKENAKK